MDARIKAPPRFYWGRSYPPTRGQITRRSGWAYITLEADGHTDRAFVESQRGAWQADLLIQAFNARICATGQRPEAGYSILTPDGKLAAVANSQGALQGFPHSYAWPFAHADSTFRARLNELAHQYDFRVTSSVTLHALGDAPQLRVESDHPRLFLRNLAAIQDALYPVIGDCSKNTSCFNGDWTEATDSTGQPFAVTAGFRTIGTGVGGWGSQWVRKGLPYPFPHG